MATVVEGVTCDACHVFTFESFAQWQTVCPAQRTVPIAPSPEKSEIAVIGIKFFGNHVISLSCRFIYSIIKVSRRARFAFRTKTWKGFQIISEISFRICYAQPIEYKGGPMMVNLKEQVGIKAEFVKERDGMIVGLGTGSLLIILMTELGRRIKEEGLQITAVTTSKCDL